MVTFASILLWVSVSGGYACPLHDAARADDVETATLSSSVRTGTAQDVQFQLRTDPTQAALAYALDESVGNPLMDPVRPELLARLTDKRNLKAVYTAVQKADDVSLRQLA